MTSDPLERTVRGVRRVRGVDRALSDATEFEMLAAMNGGRCEKPDAFVPVIVVPRNSG